ncbi:MAG: hypothetical protein FWG60_01630 [Methanomassiliicoccaceae archaeon]|nr:hypothetical protein [Methanomassiliicoccaceae archaeon]
MVSKAIIAAVVVVVVVVVAAGAYVVLSNDKDQNNVKFVIEDLDGVYFWIEGSGEKVSDAFIDASEKAHVDLDYSNSDLMGFFVSGINNVYQAEDWSKYWSLSVYSDGEWKSADTGASSLYSKDYDYVGWFYAESGGAPDYTPTTAEKPSPEGAKAITVEKSPGNGKVTFLISGGEDSLCFWATGKGNDVYEAFKNIQKYYPEGVIETSVAYDGINSMFGITGESFPDGTYSWWAQFSWEDGQWLKNEVGMASIDSAIGYQLIIFGHADVDFNFPIPSDIFVPTDL